MKSKGRHWGVVLGCTMGLLLPAQAGAAEALLAQAAPPPSASSRSSTPSARSAATSELRIRTPLMRNWRFIQKDDLSEQEALRSSGAGWRTVTLPHTWNAKDAATLNATEPYERGLGWYRLEFTTPSEGERHWLEIGAASMVADVWLNGKKLGQHRGGFQQFRFDVTERLNERGRNVLLIRTDNRYPKDADSPTAILPITGDFNFSGGLYRHVALVSTRAPAHIELGDLGGPGVYAGTTAIEGGDAVVNVRTKLRNAGADAGEYTVRVSLVNADGSVAARADRRVRLPGGGRHEVAQELRVDDARLWQGRENPYLYTLRAELLRSDGRPVDALAQQFGIRQFRVDPDRGFFLNGKRTPLHGVAIHQDYLGKAWAMTHDDMEESLALVEEIGANALRLGHYPFDPYVLELADRIGLVVWAEVPFGITSVVVPPLTSTAAETACPQHDPTPEMVANIERQLKEQVRQKYNYASIAFWGRERGHLLPGAM